jgi:hypothetical protein
MNRKNLTAAVLAGLAGAAGIAGTAQAVNLNPDGLGQVLIYPYYTVNDNNTTLLSVVNTSSDAKAVKVRFKEGFNSREVLDFNMYMSAYDVWAAAIENHDGTPTLVVPDSTCTVPYLYEVNQVDGAGNQPFLPYDYDNDDGGNQPYRLDGGPTGIARAAEGYLEMIEMGTMTGQSADDVTHVIDSDGTQHPKDCQALVDAWTFNPDGYWVDHVKTDVNDPDYVAHPEEIDIGRNSGGLFGGGAIININRGTMFTYDAKAIQGFDKAEDGVHLHKRPGGPVPSLNDGDQNDATVFFGSPRDESVTLHYSHSRSIDALSAVLMRENIMNEFNIEAGINAASEWVVTFPTKSWYVDNYIVPPSGTHWEPTTDPAYTIQCHGWQPGDDYPYYSGSGTKPTSWEACKWVEVDDPSVPIPPFTSVFDGSACEPFDITIWDREESAGSSSNNSDIPIVSPPPPANSPHPDQPDICYEVNVLRFINGDNDRSVFGTPTIEGDSLLKTVDTRSVSYDSGNGSKPVLNGWAMMNLATTDDALLCESYNCQSDQANKGPDWVGLQGLPVVGFWAEQIQNGYLPNNPGVLANYGGLFDHKGNVRRSGVHVRNRRD